MRVLARLVKLASTAAGADYKCLSAVLKTLRVLHPGFLVSGLRLLPCRKASNDA